MNLPADISRCAGRTQPDTKLAQECEDCQRRTSLLPGDRVWTLNMTPGSRACLMRIGGAHD